MRPKTERRARFEAETFPHLEALSRTAFWLTGDEAEGDSLVCETFAAAYRLWDVTVSTADVKTSLFKILTRLFGGSCRNHIRRPDIVASANDDGRSSAAAFEELKGSLRRNELNGDFHAAISGLPASIRIVFVLSFLEGFSYRQIAEIAVVESAEVRARLYQGRNLIQRDLYERILKARGAPGGGDRAGKSAFQTKGASS
jgi:RNA polymerase sigma-70 factor, ECF subfamily